MLMGRMGGGSEVKKRRRYAESGYERKHRKHYIISTRGYG